MSSTARSLIAYRNALRATKIAFNGDLNTLTAARQQLRQGMKAKEYENKSTEERIDLLEQVSSFLKKNIVQGRKQDDGKYFLNLHEHSEIGDNDSIKKPKSTLGNPGPASGGSGCCGGGNKVLNERRTNA